MTLTCRKVAKRLWLAWILHHDRCQLIWEEHTRHPWAIHKTCHLSTKRIISRYYKLWTFLKQYFSTSTLEVVLFFKEWNLDCKSWSSLPFHVWWLKTDMLTELLQQSRQPSPLELVWCTKWGQSWHNTGTWLPLSQPGPRHHLEGWRVSVRRCPRCWAVVRMRGAGFCGSCWSRKTKRVGRRVREHRSHWTIGLETRTSKMTPNRFWNGSFADVLCTV